MYKPYRRTTPKAVSLIIVNIYLPKAMMDLPNGECAHDDGNSMFSFVGDA